MNYTYFTEEELKCKCGCQQSNPNPEFHQLMIIMDLIRLEVGFPLIVTSAYRCKDHPIEAEKIANGGTAGRHNIGAIDLGISGIKALKLLTVVTNHPTIQGVGLNQKGPHKKRIVHLDNRIIPALWTY